MAEILIVDDQDHYLDLCRRAISEHRYRGPARSWREAAEALGRARGAVDLVLLDVHFAIPAEELVGTVGDDGLEGLQRRQGLEILALLRARYPDLPVILMTSREDVVLEDVAAAGQEYTYFLDDDYVDARSLQAQIANILAAREGDISEGPIFWGRSLVMRQLRQRLKVLALGRLPVLLLGPTGTGKSLLARHHIHQRSGRRGQFVAVDLSTVPNELMSATLFGASRGAYTGATSDRAGAFETADGGTLFLDEVGNLSADAQKMLLSVLQESVVVRLGEVRERSVDVKLVVATHEDLAERVAQGLFRADLYMRLNPAAAVRLPPLAERSIDLVQLLEFGVAQALRRPYLSGLVGDYCERNGLRRDALDVVVGEAAPARRQPTLTLLFPERSVRLLRAHTWPGNLREFAMVVENAALFAVSEMLALPSGERADVLAVRPKVVRDLLGPLPAEALRAAERSAERAEAPALDAGQLVVTLSPQDSLNKVAQETERQYFVHLYIEHRGDFAKMAIALLGDAEHARKVQLRFNQLGLKVRDMKELLG